MKLVKNKRDKNDIVISMVSIHGDDGGFIKNIKLNNAILESIKNGVIEITEDNVKSDNQNIAQSTQEELNKTDRSVPLF